MCAHRKHYDGIDEKLNEPLASSIMARLKVFIPEEVIVSYCYDIFCLYLHWFQTFFFFNDDYTSYTTLVQIVCSKICFKTYTLAVSSNGLQKMQTVGARAGTKVKD